VRRFTTYPKSYVNASGTSPRLKIGHWYKFNNRGDTCIGQYTGTDQGFECSVCGKGGRAKTFNVWYADNGYETWGFGPNHMPEILEDLGEQDDIIIGE
jgi:hypothetical protein